MKKGKSVEIVKMTTLKLKQERAKFFKQHKLDGDSGDSFVLMCGDGGNDVGALKQVTYKEISFCQCAYLCCSLSC